MADMDMYTAMEESYKNGYVKGFEDGKKAKPGRWILRQFTEEWYCYRCSECSTTWDADTNYCPNCGADMRGSLYE